MTVVSEQGSLLDNTNDQCHTEVSLGADAHFSSRPAVLVGFIYMKVLSSPMVLGAERVSLPDFSFVGPSSFHTDTTCLPFVSFGWPCFDPFGQLTLILFMLVLWFNSQIFKFLG